MVVGMKISETLLTIFDFITFDNLSRLHLKPDIFILERIEWTRISNMCIA